MTTTNKTVSVWKRKLYSSVCTQLIAWTELFFSPFSKSNMQCWRYDWQWWHILVENNKSFICILYICAYEIKCKHINILIKPWKNSGNMWKTWKCIWLCGLWNGFYSKETHGCSSLVNIEMIKIIWNSRIKP